MTFFQISELARRGGVSASTWHYYEQVGLLLPAARIFNLVFDGSTISLTVTGPAPAQPLIAELSGHNRRAGVAA